MVKNEVGSFINATIYHGRKFLFGFRNSGNSFESFVRCNFVYNVRIIVVGGNMENQCMYF